MELEASRMSKGNFLYPVSLELSEDRVALRRQKRFSTTERAIPLSKISAVTIRSGIWFGAIRIGASGGTDDIVADGFPVEALKHFRDALQERIALKTTRADAAR